MLILKIEFKKYKRIIQKINLNKNNFNNVNIDN